MINNYKAKIEKILGESINHYERLTPKKLCYLAYTASKKYVIKIINYNDESFFIHNTLKNLNYDCFPKIVGIIQVKQLNKYLLIIEWTQGNIPNIQLSENNIEKEINTIKEISKTLLRMHNEARFIKNDKIDSKSILEKIKNSQQPEIITSYVLKNIHKIENRTKCLIHGDFHRENIIIKKKIFLIDIDDLKFDDAYKDLVYVANLHKSYIEDNFYYFMLQLYFNFNIPEDFWKIVNCYSIVKIIDIMQKEKKLNSKQYKKITWESFLKQHNYMEQDIPIWFQKTDLKFKNSKSFERLQHIINY